MVLIKYFLIKLILVALSGFSVSVMGQGTGTVTGEILDQSTGEELVGANVRLEGTNMGAATDMDGEFTIRGVPEGNYTLVVTYLGYQSFESDLEITAGETVELTLELLASGLEGDEVVISVQARGQTDAINRQMASRTISNIVSSERIREVPDVNAAESIGRLPGISIQRSGGEANKVAIRGLSPKYNAITVDGVRMSATDSGDRSVDLSMISPESLGGIEVTKANLPYQDADAIGGTVDLQMREAEEGLNTDFTIEGGYNRLQESYGNYKLTGSLADRFLDGRVGAIVNFNLEERDRSTDRYNADYGLDLDAQGRHIPRTDFLSLEESALTRSRMGGSVLLDFQLPDGKISINNFYSSRINDEILRANNYGPDEGERYHNFNDNRGELTVHTHSLHAENEFRWFEADAVASVSRSHNYSPENRSWSFLEQSAFSSDLLDRNDPQTIPESARNDLDGTALEWLDISTHESEEITQNYQANVHIPFNITTSIYGEIQTGGKFMHRSRFNDAESWGDGMYWGGDQTVRRMIAQEMPELGIAEDGTQQIIMEPLLTDYDRDNFLDGLDGDWPLGFTPDINKLHEITDLIEDSEFIERDVGSTFRDDYEGGEQLYAGYAMAELNLGQYFTLIPGFRYEEMHTDYTAQFVREARVPERGDPGAAIQDTTATRNNDFFLPMYHLQIHPTEWMDIRLARTNTITRPDYWQFSPRLSIGQYGNFIYAGNPTLEPSESLNHDASVSIHTNEIGLFTVSAFHKQIDGLIWFASFRDRQTEDGEYLLDLSDVPGITGTPQVQTALNNQNPAYFRGIEFDWQTNFWWLPSPFDGIVLNMNYSRIHSETDYTRYVTKRIPDPDSPFPQEVVSDTTRTGRMPDQPDDIANIQLGYDYGGFSGRISLLYQGNTLSSVGGRPEEDIFTDDYIRLDARINQRIFQGLQLFVNLNNINNRPDRGFQQELGMFPTNYENYGFTFDIGVRYRN